MVPHPHKNQNLNFNHVGVSVDSIDKATEWYGKHFGFRRVRNELTVDRATDPPEHPMFRVYGDKLKKVKICFLSAGNGVGIELFEFVDPPVKSAEELRRGWSFGEQYTRGGVFHIAVTSPEPKKLAKEVCEDGATQIGEALTTYDGETQLYIRDPWGLLIEVMSCSYEQLAANRE